MDERETRELRERLAALEERMNTRQAEYKTDIARLAEDNAKNNARLEQKFAELKADFAQRDAEAARRDRANLQWLAGMLAASVLLTITVLRWLDSEPASPVYVVQPQITAQAPGGQ